MSDTLTHLRSAVEEITEKFFDACKIRDTESWDKARSLKANETAGNSKVAIEALLTAARQVAAIHPMPEK